MTRAVGSLVLVATVAFAQVPSSDVEQVWVDSAGRGSLWVGNGQALQAGQFRGGAALTFSAGTMRTASSDSPETLVSSRFGLQVFGALGLFDWLEASVVVPAIVFQQGSEAVPVAPAGLGNPWLHVRVPIWADPRRPLLLSAGLGVALPVGTGAALGNGGAAFMPRITVGHLFRTFQFGVELSGVLRSSVDYSPRTGNPLDVVGPQVALATMVTSLASTGPRGEASLRVFAPLTGGRMGLEALFGVRWTVGPVEYLVAAGPGLFGEPGTPQARALLGTSFADVAPPRPACTEASLETLAECPDLDFDGDGVPNLSDLAPTEPEDRDGFQDEDGVPDRDNDGDGLSDAGDRCPDERGPPENEGCPERDRDGDGLVDRLDRCPTEAGSGENAGCPTVPSAAPPSE